MKNYIRQPLNENYYNTPGRACKAQRSRMIARIGKKKKKQPFRNKYRSSRRSRSCIPARAKLRNEEWPKSRWRKALKSRRKNRSSKALVLGHPCTSQQPSFPRYSISSLKRMKMERLSHGQPIGLSTISSAIPMLGERKVRWRKRTIPSPAAPRRRPTLSRS